MQKDYHLTDDSDLSAFLGIQIDKRRTSTGSLEYTLKHPNYQNLRHRANETPANKILYKGGELRKTKFHYRSAIGQLNYLTALTSQAGTHVCYAPMRTL
jgi:hypothetical protein